MINIITRVFVTTIVQILSSLYVVVEDITPPVITNCPADIIRQVHGEQQSIKVSWTEPTATDDMTPTNQITTVATHQPNQLFTAGNNIITYVFRDKAGNEARCSFNVHIQGKEFREVYY